MFDSCIIELPAVELKDHLAIRCPPDFFGRRPRQLATAAVSATPDLVERKASLHAHYSARRSAISSGSVTSFSQADGFLEIEMGLLGLRAERERLAPNGHERNHDEHESGQRAR